MENRTKLNAVPLRCAIKTNYKQMGIGRPDETLDGIAAKFPLD
jgi:hypothetical protein